MINEQRNESIKRRIPKRKSNRESCILTKILLMVAEKVCGAK